MIANKIFLLALMALTCEVAISVDLIEMNDRNKNMMSLDLSKALAEVQDAYQAKFSFERIGDIKNFLSQCKLVENIISKSDNSDFGGLAAQIKRLMSDEAIAKPCSVTEDRLDDLEKLDTGIKASEHDYLSLKAFNTLTQLNKKVEQDEPLKIVAGHALRTRVKQLADALLESATHTINIYLGETRESKGWFDFDIVPKQLCETSLIGPICRLVRRTTQNVGVIAQDFDDFAEAVSSKDNSMIDTYVHKSGVSMNVLQDNCKRLLKRVFKPIDLIRNYVAAGFIDEQQLESHMKEDSVLNSYNSLYELCVLVG